MNKSPEKPHSLTRERVEQFLPKFRERSGKWKLIASSVKMTEPEAKYIILLDVMFTGSELSAVLLGRASLSDGMKLVDLAEKRLGKDYIPAVAVDKDNENGEEKPEGTNDNEDKETVS